MNRRCFLKQGLINGNAILFQLAGSYREFKDWAAVAMRLKGPM